MLQWGGQPGGPANHRPLPACQGGASQAGGGALLAADLVVLVVARPVEFPLRGEEQRVGVPQRELRDIEATGSPACPSPFPTGKIGFPILPELGTTPGSGVGCPLSAMTPIFF